METGAVIQVTGMAFCLSRSVWTLALAHGNGVYMYRAGSRQTGQCHVQESRPKGAIGKDGHLERDRD